MVDEKDPTPPEDSKGPVTEKLVKATVEQLKELVRDFPQTAGVYLMKNLRGKVIYVGKAKNLRSRVRSYFNLSGQGTSLKTVFLVNQIHSIEIQLTKTEVEAFLLEASLIKKYRPRYNIRLKDDKAYPYIVASVKDNFPRFYVARRVKNDGNLYFGPFISGGAVRETIRFLNRTYKIRDCTDSFFKGRTRPCMTYQIGRCTAPCVDLVSIHDYREDFAEAISFLKGEDQKVIKQLTKRMKLAADDERYETAGKLRDSIDAVKRILEKQSVVGKDQEFDQDVVAYVGDPRGTLIEVLHIRRGRVIGSQPYFLSKLDFALPGEEVMEWLTSFLNQYYSDNIIPDEILLPVELGIDMTKLLKDVFEERQGKRPDIRVMTGQHEQLLKLTLKNAQMHFDARVTEKENRLKGLEDLQKKLGLPELPLRIECYDISNFQGSESVASQVVFEEGSPKKEDYRKYKIKTVIGSNDFASMKEVLERRFKHTEYDDPQLVVVDGGKGQLSMAVEILKEVGRPEIPVVGLAKARTKGSFQDAEVESSEERVFIPGRQNPVTFARNAEALQILVGIRDEAHRFAITFHRKLREARTLESELDSIVGLGVKRKDRLLKSFDGIQAIKDAGIEAIAALPGFNRVLAERILLQLSEQ